MGITSSDYACGLRDAASMLDLDWQTVRLHAGELSVQEMLARAKVAPGAGGWLERAVPRMKGASA